MKNFEKYKTIDEMVTAHENYCKEHAGDVFCNKNGCKECAFNWLYLEAEEKTKPCPFCGGEVHISAEFMDTDCAEIAYIFDCYECDAVVSFVEGSEEAAIEQWNRRTDK